MKTNRIIKKLKTTLYLCFIGISVATSLEAGNKVNNGGSTFPQEVKHRFEALLGYIKQNRSEQNILNDDQIDRLEEVLWDTRIELSDQPPVDARGQEVDAINQVDPNRPGKKMLVFHRERLEKLFAPDQDQVPSYRFILHEFLQVAGIDDEQNELSVKLMMGFSLRP
jgi:hypothetical protein